jgi:RimJ/RimL family protein N-acetyltransferase
MAAVAIRLAEPADEAALAALDLASWTILSSPAPRPDPASEWTFFDERTTPDDVLLALLGDDLAGYVRLGRATPLEASDHVRTIAGFVVDARFRRRGVGRALLDATATEARRRGARRLTLRVLAANESARRLYESAGFVVEGVLREEFLLDGAYVDDVLMALDLRARRPPG